MRATVTIELDRGDGLAIVKSHHVFERPDTQGWSMRPGIGGIVEGDYIYFGYTIELFGRLLDD